MDEIEVKDAIEALERNVLDRVTKLESSIGTLDEKVARVTDEAKEIAKKANRPQLDDGSEYFSAVDNQEGVKVLTAAHLKSRATIAARLKIKPPAEGKRIGMGEFLRAVAGMKTESKGLIEGTDPSGGYAVPDELLPDVLAALAPASSLLNAGANMITLDDPARSYRIAAVSTIPTASWRGENQDIAESDPAFRAITLYPKSLAFYFKVSRELIGDSMGLDDALNTVIGQAFAKAIDRAALLGSGAANEPQGLVNTPNIGVVDLGNNGTALADFGAFTAAMTKIMAADAPNATAAIMAPRTLGDISNLTDTTGQPLRRPDALADWAFLTTSQLPVNLTVGTSDDCSQMFVGDFRNFNFYMRENLSVQLLREAFATTGQVGFVCHARVDMAALYPQAFCLVNGVRPAA